MGGARTGDEAALTGMHELAYVLATAFRKMAATMQPVRERLAASDTHAIRRLDAAFALGLLRTVKTP